MRVAHDTQWSYTETMKRLHDSAHTAQPYAKAKTNADADACLNANAAGHADPSGPGADNVHAAVIMSVLWKRWPPDSAHAAPPGAE
ncbi:hypothetical protein BAU07_01870 [Bordetella flabilis]|uniref:Uncharacterized protein n=1 Tax=Bordetella flabilis TaxID=463014 RepID=A0A193G990_9BORD|nr:hypothetical protein BAU07_01870 [Bordetella flabilis]